MKKITREQYYGALGCFLVAHQRWHQAYEMEQEMQMILDPENPNRSFDHLSDAVGEHHEDAMAAFNSALSREDIEVEDDAGRDSQAAETGSGEGSGSGDGP